MTEKNWNTDDLLAKYDLNDKAEEDWVVECHYTGYKINLSKNDNYHLDHVTPRSRGGTGDLDNCVITTAAANQAKGSMTNEEFIAFCEKVIAYDRI